MVESKFLGGFLMREVLIKHCSTTTKLQCAECKCPCPELPPIQITQLAVPYNYGAHIEEVTIDGENVTVPKSTNARR